ncbi:TPA_asm: hypothetical protein [Porphyromonas phage phage011a_WW2952]|uniref:Uncharacterized protein n=1 Tax=Porphyromonas phage phage011a_WW2952 TaxID=3154101 RepID=A0AAT9JBE5_9CAUD
MSPSAVARIIISSGMTKIINNNNPRIAPCVRPPPVLH